LCRLQDKFRSGFQVRKKKNCVQRLGLELCQATKIPEQVFAFFQFHNDDSAAV
jgi:hypothetical protein